MEKKRSEDGRRMLEEFERSSLTRREFCERNKIPVTTLDYWRWKKAKATKARLVEVAVETEEPRSGFVVVLASGRRIETEWNFREVELSRLIRIVESA